MQEIEPWKMFHLVALQVADQVPPEGLRDGAHLVERLLDPVFTNVPEAHTPRGLQRIGPVSLGHRHDRDRLAVTAAPNRCIDPLPHLPNPVREVEKRHKTPSYR